MLKDEMLREFGFSELKFGYYTKAIDEIIVIFHEEGSDMKFTSYCTPARIDTEHELDGFLKRKTAGSGCKSVSYSGEKLEMRYYSGDEQYSLQNMQTALKVIASAAEEYDLLPTCMNCHKTGPVEFYDIGGRTGPVCALCRSEEELRLKHEQITASHTKKDTIARKIPLLDRGPLISAVKIGFKAGLIGGLVGFIITVLGYIFFFIPVLGAFAYAAGPVAGFITMHNMRKLDYFDNGLRTLLSCLVSLITLVFCAYFGFALLVALGKGSILILFTAVRYIEGFGLVILLQGIVGITLFLLIVAFVYFVDIDI